MRKQAVSRLVLGLTVTVVACGALFDGSALAAWSPEPATYGVYEQQNVPVTMTDGTVLRVNVYYPAENGGPAPGSFPVLLTQTPYGKDTAGSVAGGNTGEDTYLIERGYIDVVADVRGTGDSGGQFGFFDPAQQQDGATLVRWAAGLPGSDGKVGLYGASYLGINQLLTVGQLGPNSPVKAIFPVISGNDLYRDTAFDGGLLDIEFGSLYVGLTGSLNEVNPVSENPGDPLDTLEVELQHTADLASFDLPLLLNTSFDGDQAFDGTYWQARSPIAALQQVVRDNVPAYLVGGWYDLFQRGEPLNFSGLQNALAGRSVYAPMSSSPSSGRYQLMMGPWYHLTAASQDFDPLMLAWFDRWLKNVPTGIDQTTTPAHLYLLGANKYVDETQWPPAGLAPTTWYLGAGPSGSGAPSQNDGTLTQTAPTAATGADQVEYVGANAPCSRELDQWSMGAFEDVTGPSNPNGDPCAQNDALTDTGPGALTYTSAPFSQDTVLGGPVDATIYATSTRPDTEWVATLEDVAPDGTATPITTGALLGSLRAVDPARSWVEPDGRMILPYHPYTAQSKQPVPTGVVTRFDIEIRPTFADIVAGDRLRLTLTTSDLPALIPTEADATNLVGGVYQVERNQSAASYVEVLSGPASEVN
jgi:uncharacterized protein